MTDSDVLTAAESDLFRIFRAIGQLTLPLALLSAIGYYCGFQTQAAYLISFGIPDSVGKSDPAYLIGLGWLEIAISVFTLAIVASLWSWTKNLSLHTSRRGRRMLLITFCVFWLISFVILPTIVVWLYVSFLRGYEFLIGLGFWTIALMTCVFLGNQIRGLVEEFHSTKVRKLFRTMYPGLIVFLTLIGLVWFLLISTESALRGVRLAQRDQGPNSRLTRVTLVSDSALMLPNQQVNTLNQFVYQDARLVTTGDKFVFVSTGSITSDPVTLKTFAIPIDSIAIMDVRSWWEP